MFLRLLARRPGRRRLGLAALAATAAVALAACGSPSSPSSSGHSKGSIVVGSAGFSESEILAYMYADLLDKIGYHATVTTVESSEIFTPSLEKGTIGVAPEYAATYADELQQMETGTKNPNAGQPSLTTTMANLQRLARHVGLVALTPAKALDQNAFAVSKSFATRHHLSTLSQLGATHIPVSIAGPAECATRPYCAPGLRRVYGIRVTKIDPLGFDTTQGKAAVEHGTDQVAEVATTDATLAQFGLVLLADNKHLQNADYVVPIVNKKYATAAVKAELDKLSAVLTTGDLTRLDGAVGTQRVPAATAAHGFLTAVGLL
jgi:osmoprotectant transport system substrate-binding protein